MGATLASPQLIDSRKCALIYSLMRLSSLFPTSSQLSPKSFKTWDTTRGERRLVLSCTHSVAAKLGERYAEGGADIAYVLQVPAEPPEPKLVVTPNVPLIGVQAPDLIRSITEAYRPRTSIALSEVGSGLFDLRALAYVVGAAAASGSADVRFPFESVGASTKPLSPSWTVPHSKELTLGPGLVENDKEYQTLSALAKAAGVCDIQIMGDSIPTATYKPYQGTRLASLCMRLFAYIMCSANACGCADHHLEAFFRGMTSTFSLWAHSDEGGWIRKVLAKADYPPSSGVLASTAEEVMGIPTRHLIPRGEVTRLIVALYLEMAGAIPKADAWATGISSSFECEEGADARRPSAYLGLRDAFYGVMDQWRDWAASTYGLAKSLLLDTHSARTYFKEDRFDDHLASGMIVPFWWVEPSAISVGTNGSLFMPCSHSGPVSLPYMRGEATMTPSQHTTPSGTLPRGVPIRVIRKPGGLRDEGASYLLSQRYTGVNGLAALEYTTVPEKGVHTTEAMFVGGGITNGSWRRWITPHNPLPSPLEGYTDQRTCVEYVYSGGPEPTKSDWVTGTVTSFLGFFELNKRGGDMGKRAHRSVPKHLKHLIDTYSRYRETFNTTCWFDDAPPAPNTGPAPSTATINVPYRTPPAAPAPPVGDDAPLEEPTLDLVSDTPEIATVFPPEHESPDSHPEDPSIRTIVSNTMGGRPHVPTIAQETPRPPVSAEDTAPESEGV